MSYTDMYIKFLQEFDIKEESVSNYRPWFSPYVNDSRRGVYIYLKNGSQIVYIPLGGH